MLTVEEEMRQELSVRKKAKVNVRLIRSHGVFVGGNKEGFDCYSG